MPGRETLGTVSFMRGQGIVWLRRLGECPVIMICERAGTNGPYANFTLNGVP